MIEAQNLSRKSSSHLICSENHQLPPTYIPDKETDSFLFCMKSFQCCRSPNTKSALAYEFAFQHGHARMAFCLSSCYLSPSRRMKTRCSGVFGVFSADMNRSGKMPNMQMKQRNPRSIFSPPPFLKNELRLKGRPFRHQKGLFAQKYYTVLYIAGGEKRTLHSVHSGNSRLDLKQPAFEFYERPLEREGASGGGGRDRRRAL